MARGQRTLTGRATLGALALGMVLLGGCDKLQQVVQPGKAATDSAIPPGLSPQFFPPEGFVWGAYHPANLPEVRYGVASPPANPKAQVLILADASYPAEVYFQAAQQLLDAGYGVWLLEAPGQGGSGRYLLQGENIFTPDYRDAETAARAFITDIVKPDPSKPLVVVGTGYSAVHALSLSLSLKDADILGYVAYDPYLGGPIARGSVWHANEPPGTYWGDIAQTWQSANPGLRLRVKSEAWQKQMEKAYAALDGLHMPALGDAVHPSVLLLEPKTGLTADDNAASKLCAHVAHCAMAPGDGPQTLGTAVAGFVDRVLPHGTVDGAQ